jgi:hypothetical protein
MVKEKGGRKEKEAPTGGVPMSAAVGIKRKEKGETGRCGKDVGPVGLKGNVKDLSLFSFPF